MSALHDRLMTARRDPDGLGHAAESDLLVDLAPHVEDFLGELFGIAAEVRALQARHHELAPLYSVKRLFVQRRAVKGVKEAGRRGDSTARGSRRELDALIGGPVDERSRHGSGATPSMSRAGSTTRPAMPRRSMWRSATPPGPPYRRRASKKHRARRAVQGAAPARPAASGPGRDHRARRRHHAAPAGGRLAAARRLRADRSRHRSDRRARPGELLHLVPQPGQGQLLHGPARTKDRRVQEERRSASRSPAARSKRRSPR